MAERVIDVLEAIDVDVGSDRAIVVSRAAWRNFSIFSTIFKRFGRPERRRAWLHIELGSRVAHSSEARLSRVNMVFANRPVAKIPEGYKRKDDRQQDLTGTARRPSQISGRAPSSTNKGLGDYSVRVRR